MRPNARTISSRVTVARARRPRVSRRARATARAMGRMTTSSNAERAVREMYDAINARDVEGALERVDDDVVYEDFNFPSPFVGKAAVRALFEESCRGIPDDLTLSLIHI